jgi:hypothetical protein
VTVRAVERVVYAVGNGTAALVPEERLRQIDQCQTIKSDLEGEQTNCHSSRLSSGNVQGNSFSWLLPLFEMS